MNTDEYTETLMHFGLSHVQALTYLTLVKLKKSDARTIAKLSNVARQDIYRVMPSLQKLGLVQKIIGVPTMYRATPIENATSVLLENKRDEYDKLVIRTDELIQSFRNSGVGSLDQDDETQFVLISEYSTLLKQHETLTKACECTLDLMLPLVRYSRKGEREWSQVNEALEQRPQIKVRLITQEPNDQKSFFKFWSPLVKNESFQIKYVNKPIAVFMHVFDNKQLLMSVGKNGFLPSLWCNNPTIIELATFYFNKEWNANKEGILQR
jgi:predicted transcriptional regulator